MNTMNIGYLEYRLNRIETNIEYFGGFSQISKSEQEEYKRIKSYFRAINHVAKKED